MAATSPALFLAYATLRMTLRYQYGLMRGLPSTVVVVTGEDALATYRRAADLVFNGSLDRLMSRRPERRAAVHVLESQRKGFRVNHEMLEALGEHNVVVMIARSRADIPPDLFLTADTVIDIQRPTTRHIQAARRLLGRTLFDDKTAQLVARLEFPVIVRAVCRRNLREPEAARLLESLHANDSKPPFLEDLPAYSAAKEWGKTFIEDVRRYRQGKLSWRSVMPRGVLLDGPPGTGKTLFAQALARSAGLPLISTSVSQWQSHGHLGDMLRAMRKTFETARAKQPAIVFLDELDSIGDRAKFRGDYVDYSRQVVNQLLECIDGAEGRDQVLVIGATNFRDAIDPALLRSGRIERHIRLELPDEDERADILRFHLPSDFSKNLLREVAADLVGWSGADLDMLAREAKARAGRNDRAVSIADLCASLPPVMELSGDQAYRVAVHEAGHSVVAQLLWPRSRISVSLKKKFRMFGNLGRAPGWTRFENGGEEQLLPTRKDLEDHICRILSGAAAEEFFLGARSNGFGGIEGSDLDHASKIAMRMVTSDGLGRRLRWFEPQTSGEGNFASMYSEIREEVSFVLEEQYSRARCMVEQHSSAVSQLAKELLERETLGPADVLAISKR
jgi:ATP-dependent Zn protease